MVSRWRRFVATKVVDPVAWRAKGMPIGERLAEFRAGQWDNPAVLRKRQSKRLADLLVHATTRLPFYQERVQGLSPEAIRRDPYGSLQSFPILTRSDVCDNLDGLSCEMGRGTSSDSTGGTTGTPVRFLRDKQSLAASLATTQLGYDWAGLKRGDRRVRFWGARRDFEGRRSPTARVTDFVHDRTLLDVYGLSESLMREYIDLLNRRPPVSIEGYPEAIHCIAEFAEREGLPLPKPRVIVTGAGMLYPHMREKLKEAYGAPVFDHYGSREVGLMAVECEKHCGLHVASETGVLEVVDEDGKAVGEGEMGEVLSTHLWNYTMPLIRYRNGDHAVRGRERCQCGRPYPMLEKIVGRIGACLVRMDGGIAMPELFTQIFGYECNEGTIRKFQVGQEAIDKVKVRVVPVSGTEGPSPAMREELTKRIQGCVGGPCGVEFVIEDDIEPTASGKHIYTISNVERGAAETSEACTGYETVISQEGRFRQEPL